MRLCGRGQKSPAGDEMKTQIKFGGYDGQQHEFELDRVRRQHASPEGSRRTARGKLQPGGQPQDQQRQTADFVGACELLERSL